MISGRSGLLRERTEFKAVLEKCSQIQTYLDDVEVMVEFAAEDPDSLVEANQTIAKAERVIAAMEFQRMLGGPHDNV